MGAFVLVEEITRVFLKCSRPVVTPNIPIMTITWSGSVRTVNTVDTDHRNDGIGDDIFESIWADERAEQFAQEASREAAAPAPQGSRSRLRPENEDEWEEPRPIFRKGGDEPTRTRPSSAGRSSELREEPGRLDNTTHYCRGRDVARRDGVDGGPLHYRQRSAYRVVDQRQGHMVATSTD